MLELAQTAKHFGLDPCYVYGFDLERADPGLMRDFMHLCSLRLILWDAHLAKIQADALKEGRESYAVEQQPPLVIPEFQN